MFLRKIIVYAKGCLLSTSKFFGTDEEIILFKFSYLIKFNMRILPLKWVV